MHTYVYIYVYLHSKGEKLLRSSKKQAVAERLAEVVAMPEKKLQLIFNMYFLYYEN